jgi:hypothetical protein
VPAAAQERVALAAKLKEDMRDQRAMANVESSSRLDLWWSMIFSENRYPLFRIML